MAYQEYVTGSGIKYTDDVINQVRTFKDNGMSDRGIANLLKVSVKDIATIKYILNNKDK